MKQTYILVTLMCFTLLSVAQQPGTQSVVVDSMLKARISTTTLQSLLNDNIYLNTRSTPEGIFQRPRKTRDETQQFYILAGLLFFFGVIKTVYARYFSTLFRVFFNSTLRQGQLTDQLVQAKLPSLLFNLVFFMSGGLYVYFLLQEISFRNEMVDWALLFGCFAAFVAIYTIKYMTVNFIGWITGYSAEADTYIFIVFLINKIIGVVLLPVIIVLAFSDQFIRNIILVLSLLFVGIMLLFRFVRSFSLLQHKLRISTFHFLLYIFSLEVLPLILIYKAAELFITKKL